MNAGLRAPRDRRRERPAPGAHELGWACSTPGGITAKAPRELALPLAFLGPGRYTARIWKDAADSESEPNHLTTETLNLSLADTLNLRLTPDGGFVAQLAPKLN